MSNAITLTEAANRLAIRQAVESGARSERIT
jgi:hypothetical protein